MAKMMFEKKKIKMEAYEFSTFSKGDLEDAMRHAESMGAIRVHSEYGKGVVLVSELNEVLSDNLSEAFADYDHEFNYKIHRFSEDVAYVKLDGFLEKGKFKKIMDVAKSYNGVYFSEFIPADYFQKKDEGLNYVRHSEPKERGFFFTSEEITDSFLKDVAKMELSEQKNEKLEEEKMKEKFANFEETVKSVKEEYRSKTDSNFENDETNLLSYSELKAIAAGLEKGTFEEKPSAKFKNYVPINVFVAVNEVAKKNGGSYSRDAKQFLFKTPEGRDDFIDEVAKMKVQSAEKTPSAKTNQSNWAAKKSYAKKRISDLTKSVNETLPESLVEIFKDGLKVHCPHGQVEQVFNDKGYVVNNKANYYSGLNAIILAAEMQEKNLTCSSFVDSRAIYAMREKGLDIDKKVESLEIPVKEDSTLIFGTFINKNGDRIMDTREVVNVTQLEGKDVPPEITVVNPREDFMFAKTLDEVLSKVIEAQKNKLQIDLVEIAKQAKQNAFNLCREQDAQKLQRIDAIKNIDVNAKPKTNAEKLQRFCKKAMEAHGEGYKGYVVDGVKHFLLATPNTKLENITKLIDAVAPAAVFNTKNYAYSEFVKSAVREDKKFAAKLAEVKQTRTNYSRG